VIDVATLSVIRRWALREQLSIREIARRTGLSRNTIRKYLRAGEAEPHYAKRVSPATSCSRPSSAIRRRAGRRAKWRRTCAMPAIACGRWCRHS
jgi:transposase